MTDLLAQPLRLRSGAVLPNRIVKAAMSERVSTPDGAPSVGLTRLYERWGQGGAGALITGNVMVDGSALGEEGNVVVEDERHLATLRAWARVAKAGGSQLWMQINHPGRQSPRHVSPVPVAPSAVPMQGAGSQLFAKPRALTDAEIQTIIARFATTARVAQKAGFDGVQIHGAHGYLISQFLSPRTNLRTDAWGGDGERRARFLIEIVRAVRAAVGPEFTLVVKLNSADFQRGGFTEEESMSVVRRLDAEQIDLLEISGGTYEAAEMFSERKAESTKAREAFFLEYAEKVRAFVKTPLMVTGGFRTGRGMRDALASGAVDVIGIARPLAVEPDLPRRLLADPSVNALPIRLATGVKRLDALIQGAWYQAQIDRVARGKDADARLSRLCAITGYFVPKSAFDPATGVPELDGRGRLNGAATRSPSAS